jgi:coenzyme F420-reducing hydrogenase alpha subunit
MKHYVLFMITNNQIVHLMKLTVKAGRGFAATEAPRRAAPNHRYELDQTGNILNAQIVPPTSQNQACIEEDLKEFIGGS